MSWRPHFDRTRCSDDAKTVGLQTCRKQNPVVVNKTAKVEVRITDNQFRNCCSKVASDHECTFGSATEPTEKTHDAL